MFKANAVKGLMAYNGYTLEKLAAEMGLSARTLSIKLNKKPNTFTHDELVKMVEILHITEPGEIFFARK